MKEGFRSIQPLPISGNLLTGHDLIFLLLRSPTLHPPLPLAGGGIAITTADHYGVISR